LGTKVADLMLTIVLSASITGCAVAAAKGSVRAISAKAVFEDEIFELLIMVVRSP